MQKLACILSVCLLQFYFASSQNLLSNGGFEKYTGLPNGFGGGAQLASGWDNVNLNFTSGFVGTPDYYNTAGAILGYYGPIAPYSGNAQMGFSTYYNNIGNYREYISTQLECSMVAGQQYSVSFYLSNGANGGILKIFKQYRTAFFNESAFAAYN
jgi:hypothetical protein